MKVFQFSMLGAAVLAMTACATVPEYRAATSSRSSGYFEQQIETNRYMVSYRVNDTDVETAQRLAMRRAAELTLQQGFDTFELVSKSTDREKESEVVNSLSRPDYAVTRDCGLLGCTSSVHPLPERGLETQVERAAVTLHLEILLSNKDAAVSPALYDASEVYANLSE